MPDQNDALLDLSAWPSPPPQPPSTAVPTVPRPVRNRPRVGLRAGALAALVTGILLLLLPLPGCGLSLAARLAHPAPLPHSSPPSLNDAQVRADAQVLLEAEAALAAWHPTPAVTAAPTSRTETVSDVDPHELAADEADLRAAERQVDSDQADLDRLLAAQESSSDPGAYDDRVAAAREQLDASVVTRDEARQVLAAARARTVRVRVTTAPRPSTAPAQDRAPLVRAVEEARRTQAAHLAQRQNELATWRADLQASTSRLTAHNSHVRACGRRTAVPVGGGVVLVLLGGAGLLRHRLTL